MTENQELASLFLREKPALILLGMKTGKEGGTIYATLLAKEANCTYSHTIKILNTFQKYGLVSFEKSGRIKRVSLTNAGWDIAHNLEAITKRFDQIQETGKKR
ncbi:MAG: winged helix DNA-binding protein [Nanoarchaeota archaeon]|nr:winged helix DNA-binding protein [Nanoarchaeota archaeon]